jgi:hypothetical protein
VSNRVSRRQARRWAAKEDQPQEPQQQQYESAPPAAPQRDVASQLKDLADLKAQGILTDGEFEAQKAKILAS